MDRATNRILLDLLDFGNRIPTDQDLLLISTDEWGNTVDNAVLHKSKSFQQEKFSDIYLPVRINDKWVMLICDPRAS
jgi:hypothetical protein